MERVKVSKIAKQIRGVSYKPEDLHDMLDDNSVTLLRANNIQDGKVDFEDVLYVDKSKVSQVQYLQKGDILVCASSGSKSIVGKAASIDFDGEYTFGAFCKVVRPIPEMADYLGVYFQSQIYRGIISKVAMGANINNIRNEHIDNLEIPAKTSKEISGIVQRVKLLQYIIDHRKLELQKLDELVKARFIEMFGKYENGTTTVFMEDVSEMITVGIANSATHAYAENGVIMFRNQNIKEGFLDDSDLIYITEEFASKYKTKQLKENDLLITRTGYPGIACIVPKKYEGTQTFTTLIVRLKNSGRVMACYACNYINSYYGKRYVESMKAGVAQQNFGAKALDKMPIFIPPMDEQIAFENFVERSYRTKLILLKGLEQMETLKKALMQQYFG